MNSNAQLQKEVKQLRAELASVYLSKGMQTSEQCQNEELYTLAMRGASDGLWHWDLATNNVYYSPRWKSMLGYDEHELESNLKTWAKLVHPDEKKKVIEQVQDYLNGKSNSTEIEMRMRHKDGRYIFVRSRAFVVTDQDTGKVERLIGTHVDITHSKRADLYNHRHAKILEMIAKGNPASEIYDAIALMYEERHPGLRCSMLELEGNTLKHGGAPSLPKEYCDAVNGLVNGPEVGSCGSSTYTGKRVVVENIATDPKWKNIKQFALPHGMRCCWSEPIKNSAGKVLGAFGMYYNHTALPNDDESKDLASAARLASIIMERDHNQKRIRDLAFTDELTGLSSRAHFYSTLESLIKSSERYNYNLSLLYIDLDDFKSINDSLGHDTGDLLLKEIALRLKSTNRELDYVARLSGDEFCIVVKGIADNSSVAKFAQRCLDVISKPVEFVGRKFTPACSIGIAHYPENGKDIRTLMKAADTALYSAKEHGKNCYAFYDEELSLKAEYRFKVEQYLREAIDKQQLSLVYQPQVDMKTGKITGVEALSRWNHPQLGEVSPVDFIAIAERIGMIKPLTEWVLKTACAQAVSWKQSGLPAMRMAVNISPSHFIDNDLIPLLTRVFNETGMTPNELELEVTEGVVQTNQENISVFQRLKELGVLLAIDDFGTGYSSFASLKHINVDFIKIDKYFIDDMMNDKKANILIGSMIEMGHNLGHQIVAEGVEQLEQFIVLKKLGCETVQGYLFSKPISADNVSKLLAVKTPNYAQVCVSH